MICVAFDSLDVKLFFGKDGVSIAILNLHLILPKAIDNKSKVIVSIRMSRIGFKCFDEQGLLIPKAFAVGCMDRDFFSIVFELLSLP